MKESQKKNYKKNLEKIDNLREFIQNEGKKKENFELFPDKIYEVKENIFKEVTRKKL